MRSRLAALVPLAGAAGACQYQNFQSVFGNAGAEDRQFLLLFAIFLVVCTIMYLLIIAFLVSAILRRRRGGEANVVESGRHNQSDPLMRTGLIGWGALVSVGLVALALASFLADRSLAQSSANPQLSIELTGNQWWWDATYDSSDSSMSIRTANEIHLPVGVATRIVLKSNDVIHSFWVPSLAGKQDLIPGRQNDIVLVPKKIGLYRGQCAEFCGVQHANMALVVSVDSRADFLKWWKHQLQSAPPPRTALARAGYRFVTTRTCAMCHAIAGTDASARVGPDLTHVASRRSVAAGTLPMSAANLSAWVADPQKLKPGTRMPTVGLKPDEMRAVTAYLETLK